MFCSSQNMSVCHGTPVFMLTCLAQSKCFHRLRFSTCENNSTLYPPSVFSTLASRSFMLPPLVSAVFFFSFPIRLLLLFPPVASPNSPLFSSCASTYLCPPPLLSSSCQLLMLVLIVSQLQSQEGDIQESKMAGYGRSFQCHNTQRTFCGHAKINGTSTHLLSPVCMGLWRCLVCLSCMSEGLPCCNSLF